MSIAGMIKRLLADKIYFTARRVKFALSKPSRFSDVNVIVFDLDGTLIKVNSPKELLKMKFGDEKGERISKELEGAVKKGELSIEEAMFKGHAVLVEEGLYEKDYDELLKKIEREGKLNNKLISIARYLGRTGKTIVIATMFSEIFAKKFAERYFKGLDVVIVGTKEIVAKGGKIIGVKELIGDREISGLRVRNKIDKVRELLHAKGFRNFKIALVSDSYADVRPLRKANLAVITLPKPKERDTLQKITALVKPYDIVFIEPEERELKKALRWPWTRTLKAGIEEKRRKLARNRWKALHRK